MNKIAKAAIKMSRVVTIAATLFRLLFITSPVFAASFSSSDWGVEITDLNQVENVDNAYISTGTISTLSGSSSLSDTSLHEREVIK